MNKSTINEVFSIAYESTRRTSITSLWGPRVTSDCHCCKNPLGIAYIALEAMAQSKSLIYPYI